jgi:2-phosphoglycerate kinase
VVPTELNLEPDPREAVVIPIMLASMKKEMLGRQLTRRGSEIAGRNDTNGLDNLDDIWELQSWLLDEADRAGIYIIENWSIEQAASNALNYIIGELQKYFPTRPDDDI